MVAFFANFGTICGLLLGVFDYIRCRNGTSSLANNPSSGLPLLQVLKHVLLVFVVVELMIVGLVFVLSLAALAQGNEWDFDLLGIGLGSIYAALFGLVFGVRHAPTIRCVRIFVLWRPCFCRGSASLRRC